MGDGFNYLDILLLAMVAGFVLLRLRSVLGRRTGHERPPATLGEREVEEEGKVVALPERNRRPAPEAAAAEKLAGGPAAAGLTRIQVADRSFDPKGFVEGAKAAYELVVTAFAAGDRTALKPLLSKDVFGDFDHAIGEREAAGHRQETTLVGIKSAEIVDADLKGRIAEVTIRFVSEIINATRAADGSVVAGNPNAVDQVTDVWTFARDTRSSDPNWTLIGTSAPA
jgi:predicted lipid-binding transport protein (Tim44 family)